MSIQQQIQPAKRAPLPNLQERTETEVSSRREMPMSATNRGAVRKDKDHYATPEAAFKPLLPYLARVPTAVWEPACGDRRLIRWMEEVGIESYGNDMNTGYDFLQDSLRYSSILTNPPFSLALEFCEHAIKHAPNVFMLLRLNFLASRKRRDWWRKHPPSALFILSERPSFTGDGKTDSTDYAWFYWGPLHQGIIWL